jgi:hypothetical protein
MIVPTSRESHSYELNLDGLAVQDVKQYGTYTMRTLCVLSAYGPGSTVKAMASTLQSPKARPSLKAWGFGGLFQKDAIWAGDHGFKTYQHRLGYDTWHLLALSKDPGLLPNFSQAEIARQLMSDRFTTPMLPHWVPFVASRLILLNRLFRLKCFGSVDAGIIQATTKHTDAIVSAGIRAGELTFTSEGQGHA